MKTSKQTTGNLGENIACKYLVAKGYVIRETNYWKKWGEIDVIAMYKGCLHFVEVKTVTRERWVPDSNGYQAEDNIHSAKLARLGRAAQTYLLDFSIPEETE